MKTETTPINHHPTPGGATGRIGAKHTEGPSGAPEWRLRFTVTPLFPTSHKASEPAEGNCYAKQVHEGLGTTAIVSALDGFDRATDEMVNEKANRRDGQDGWISIPRRVFQ